MNTYVYFLIFWTEKCKKNKKSNDKTKFAEVIDRECNFENDKLHMNSSPSQSRFFLFIVSNFVF